MVKRKIDEITIQPCQSCQIGQRNVRPRSKEYMNNAAKHQNIHRMGQFLLTELDKLTQLANNVHRHTTPSKQMETAVKSLGSNIRARIQVHDEKYQENQIELKQQAESKIALNDCYYLTCSKIESSDDDVNNNNNKSDDSDVCPLTMLNQGPETNTMLQGLISEFAGVPDANELEDWIEVSQLVQFC